MLSAMLQVAFLILLTISHTSGQHSYDGRFNNFLNPTLGAANSNLIRLSFPDFADNANALNGQTRPPNRALSNLLDGPTGKPSFTNNTVLFIFFGQALVAEILETAANSGCPREYINIVMPKCDPVYDKSCTGPYEMPIKRVEYRKNTGHASNQPRIPVNKVSAFIDGTLFYGNSKYQSDLLRTFRDGKMLMSEGDLLPPNTHGIPMDNPSAPGRPNQPFVHAGDDMYAVGNFGGNENPMLAIVHTIFVREHNRLAEELKTAHPKWGDEEIFQRARQFVIAFFQKITVRDFLPSFFNIRLPAYDGYKGFVDPSIAVEFGLSMRFGHSLVPVGFSRRDLTQLPGCVFKAPRRLCNTLFDAKHMIDMDGGIETLLFGALTQTTEQEDAIMTDDLRNSVYGPIEHTRRDLATLNIQRSREFGIPDYNTVRKSLGLHPYSTFQEITGDPVLAAKMSALYGGNINNIDYFMGSFVEKDPFIGENDQHLARAVIANQFARIRDGDRWWYANADNGLFTQAELDVIESTTYGMIIRRNLRAGDPTLIPDDVFHVPTGPGSCPAITLKKEDLEPCTDVFRYDFWTPESISHIPIIVASIVVFAILFALAFYGYYRCHRARYYQRLIKHHGPVITRPMCERVVTLSNMRRAQLSALPASERSELENETFGDSNGSWRVGDTGSYGDSSARDSSGYSGASDVELLSSASEQQESEGYSGSGYASESLPYGSGSSTSEPARLADKAPDRSRSGVSGLSEGVDVGEVIESFAVFDGTLEPSSLRSVAVFDSYIVVVGPNGMVTNSVHVERLDELVHNAGYTELLLVSSGKFYSMLFLSPKQSLALLVERIGAAYASATGKQLESRTESSPAKRKGHVFKKKVRDVRPVVQRLFAEHASSTGIVTGREVIEEYIQALAHEDETTDLNRRAFVRVMHLAPGTLLARHMFRVADRNKNGVISVAEFATFFDKYRPKDVHDDNHEFLFQLFDIDEDGVLMRDEFAEVLRWEASLNGAEISRDASERAARLVFDGVGLKDALTIDEFKEIAKGKNLSQFSTVFSENGDNDGWLPIQPRSITSSDLPKRDAMARMKRWLNYKAPLVYATFIFLFISCILFLERFYTYAVEKQMNDLPRIAGYGISVTRGTAQVMNFAFPLCLLTMARGLWAWLGQNPWLSKRLPLSEMKELHQIIAWTGFISAAIHVMGHFFNFSNASKTTPEDVVGCALRELHVKSDQLTTFGGYYFFGTQTGTTGYLLVLSSLVFVITSTSCVRKRFFTGFWKMHHIYVIFLILCVVHGTAQLVQIPVFWIFLFACAIPYIIDRIIRLQYSTVYVRVAQATLHGNYVAIKFRLPPNFSYKAGQYANINCPAIDRYTAHPFSLTSATSDTLASCLIRATGPWTHEFMRYMRQANQSTDKEPLVPTIRIDGPFGIVPNLEANIDVAVLVASGVGVSPVLAILKELYLRHEIERIKHQTLVDPEADGKAKKRKKKRALRKIYFFWVAAQQSDFALGRALADLYREGDRSRVNEVVETHAFLTYSHLPRVDVPMLTLLWAENERISGGHASFITGFPGRTHFGRPAWEELFGMLADRHPGGRVGVYSCTNPGMNSAIKYHAFANQRNGTEFIVSSDAAFA